MLDGNGVVAEVRHPEIAQEHAAVRVRVCPHPPRARRRERPQLGAQAAVVVEQLVGAVAAHPGLELAHVIRAVRQIGERDLMRAP